MKDYSVSEIYDIGIEIEKNGEIFYRKMAEKSSDADIRRFFEDLANWETVHVSIFQSLKEIFTDNFEEDSGFDIDYDYSKYLKAAADSHVFLKDTDIDALANECETPIDALRLALRFEKDSVVLYETMKSVLKNPDTVAKIDELAGEEIKHVAIIQSRIELLR